MELVQDRAVGVTKGEDFAVTLAKGDRTVHAKRLVIATGLRDELPAVPGVAERFGRDVIHCPFCHGWEVRDQTFGVLASTPASVHQALLVTRWSKDVTLFLHTVTEDDLTDDDRHRLGRAGVTVVPGEVESLTTDADRLTGVRLTNGTTYARETLFVAPRPVPRNALFESFGRRTDGNPVRHVSEDRRDRPDNRARRLGRRATRSASASRSSTRRVAATARRRQSWRT